MWIPRGLLRFATKENKGETDDHHRSSVCSSLVTFHNHLSLCDDSVTVSVTSWPIPW